MIRPWDIGLITSRTNVLVVGPLSPRTNRGKMMSYRDQYPDYPQGWRADCPQTHLSPYHFPCIEKVDLWGQKLRCLQHPLGLC